MKLVKSTLEDIQIGELQHKLTLTYRNGWFSRHILRRSEYVTGSYLTRHGVKWYRERNKQPVSWVGGYYYEDIFNKHEAFKQKVYNYE